MTDTLHDRLWDMAHRLPDDKDRRTCVTAADFIFEQHVKIRKLQSSFQTCLDIAEGIKNDPLTSCGLHYKIQNSNLTARDFMVAVVEDIMDKIRQVQKDAKI